MNAYTRVEGPCSLGIMQGRLSEKINQPLQSFPWESWRNEFAIATELGFDSIEWLVDDDGEKDNPIYSELGRNEILALSSRYGISVRSLCAHCFISGDLIGIGKRQDDAIAHLVRIVDCAAALGVDKVILPAMDVLSLRSLWARGRFSGAVRQLLDGPGPSLLLESDLPGAELSEFIGSFCSDRLGVLYDLGNAHALGFDFESDFANLGGLIREIHIKDRESGTGASRRLGFGGTPFTRISKLLSTSAWKGPIVLETPMLDDWHEEALHNIRFTRDWLTTIGSLQ